VHSSFARVGQAVAILAFATACGGLPSGIDLGATQAAAHHPAVPASGAVGHDVGAISCLSTLPSGGSFGVIGATAGRPFHRSGCLDSEYTWARGMTYLPEYYVNLANPGHKSSHWRKAGAPRPCHHQPKYDAGCAYDYGYETAATAWQYVTAAGSNGQGRWWLDVEPDNSWGTSPSGVQANIVDIRGALHYLRSRPHTTVGIYTETTWWASITGHTKRFSGVAVWGGGADSKPHARQNCQQHSITGGPAQLAQWIAGGVDHDVAC
jgi:hypothetical protein